MIKIYKNKQLGTSNLGWLNSHFHFSFADYYNPARMSFGPLRVINDDLIKVNTGFDTHPHRDMEIITYVIDGELTHADNMGNKHTLQRGQVQYMSAGTGVFHSEYNRGEVIARLLQIWIMPDKKGYKPNYGDYRFEWDLRSNKLLHLVSGIDGSAPVKIHQDANIYALELEHGKKLEFEVKPSRQVYVVQIEGETLVNQESFQEGDGLESVEENLHIEAISKAHLLFIEMKKEN
jgi:redox-sensitive bicupin YhaK (pirin superfamily)